MKKKKEEEFIIKFKAIPGYLGSISEEKYGIALDPEKAMKCTQKEVKEIKDILEHEIVNYEEEVYEYKRNNYKVYVDSILNSEGEIKKDDLISFCQEYEFAADGSGRFTAYISLKEQYPNSKIIDEIVRVGYLIDSKCKITMYEYLVNLSKDEEFNKNQNNKVIITEENTEEYKKAKIFVENMKKKCPFDFDCEEQYELLDRSFRDKYISRELYKEFYEDYYEEEYEPDDI